MSYEAGRMHYMQGRYERAMDVLRQGLERDPLDSDSMALLARCYSHLDDFKTAIQMGRQAIALDPDNYHSHFLLAMTYISAQKPDWGLKAAKEAVRLAPEEPLACLGLANVYVAMGKWKLALESAEDGLQFNPEDSNLLNIRATALQGLGKHDLAAEAINDALKLNPQDQSAQTLLGYKHLHERKYGLAKEAFREALRLDPNDEYAREGMLSAMRTTFLPYRWLLAFNLWRLRFGYQGAFAVGLIVFFILRTTARGSARAEQLGPFRYAIVALAVAAIALFFFGHLIANALLFFTASGRYVLTKIERTIVVMFLTILAINIVSLGIALATHKPLSEPLAFGLISIVLIALSDRPERQEAKRVFSWVCFSLALLFSALGFFAS